MEDLLFWALFKKRSVTLDFIEVDFENGCCKAVNSA
jgi:hypothetical protein